MNKKEYTDNLRVAHSPAVSAKSGILTYPISGILYPMVWGIYTRVYYYIPDFGVYYTRWCGYIYPIKNRYNIIPDFEVYIPGGGVYYTRLAIRDIPKSAETAGE